MLAGVGVVLWIPDSTENGPVTTRCPICVQVVEFTVDRVFGTTREHCGCGSKKIAPPPPSVIRANERDAEQTVIPMENRICAACHGPFSVRRGSDRKTCSHHCRVTLAHIARGSRQPRTYRCTECNALVTTSHRYHGQKCLRCYSRERWAKNKHRYRPTAKAV